VDHILISKPDHPPGTYYAAHVGIALKAPDVASRNVLSEILCVLERMKENIGMNDAVDIEADSYAYVEKFGLKTMAAAEKDVREGGKVNKSVVLNILLMLTH
jgi:hypothetical protein